MNIDKNELKDLIRETMEESKSVEERGKTEEKQESTVSTNLDMKEVVNSITDSIVKAIQEKQGGNDQDAEALKNKLYNPKDGFTGIKYPTASEYDNLTDNDKIAVYFKALMSPTKSAEDLAVMKGLSEGVAEDGGNLVPTPLFNEIMRLLPDMAIMRNLADTVTMSSKTLKIPTQTAEPMAYWIGERQTKTTTSADFGSVTLSANKLVARILISEELNDDAIVDMIPYITRIFAQAIATAEDKAFFTGSGTGQPKGISQETLASFAVGGTFDFDDVITLIGLVRQVVRKSANTAFVGSKEVIEYLRRMKDSDGAYIWRMGGRANNGEVNSFPETVYGYPIYEQNDLPTSELYFGDWSKYLIGDRKQLTVRTTDQNETAWTQDAVDIKAVERVDGRAVLTGAFAKLTGI